MEEANHYIKLQPLGEVDTFLGINISIDKGTKTLYMYQHNYTNTLLDKYSKNNLYPCNIPFDNGIKLRKNELNALLKEITLYQQYIGSLLFLVIKTRPNITFIVQNCAKYASNPAKDHFIAVNKIFGYLKKYPILGILYRYNNINNLLLKGYSDADWANCIDSRRSTIGYLFTLGNNNLISWASTLQKTIALSSCEA
jgi:hypothetical protein